MLITNTREIIIIIVFAFSPAETLFEAES